MNWAEARVITLAQERGHSPRRSNGLEDSALHIDLWLTIDGQELGVDVKDARRINRRDPNPSAWYTWLELRNRNGLRGSLFGKAKYLVIASPRGWLWVDRSDLVAEAVLRYIEHSGCTPPGEAWHCKYRGHSVIILAPYYYLYKVARDVWPDKELQARSYAATE